MAFGCCGPATDLKLAIHDEEEDILIRSQNGKQQVPFRTV